MNFTRKRLAKVPAGRNSDKNLDQRRAYALSMSNISDASLIFLDETGFNLHTSCNYGYSPKNQKAYITVPSNRGINVSVLCAISKDGLVAYEIIQGAFNANMFIEFVMNKLKDNLGSHQTTIVMDNCRIHKTPDVLEAITSIGLSYRFLPPYSPQLNPIEQYFGALKAKYKAIRPRPDTRAGLVNSIQRILDGNDIEVNGFFREARRWLLEAVTRQIFI